MQHNYHQLEKNLVVDTIELEDMVNHLDLKDYRH